MQLHWFQFRRLLGFAMLISLAGYNAASRMLPAEIADEPRLNAHDWHTYALVGLGMLWVLGSAAYCAFQLLAPKVRRIWAFVIIIAHIGAYIVAQPAAVHFTSAKVVRYFLTTGRIDYLFFGSLFAALLVPLLDIVLPPWPRWRKPRVLPTGAMHSV